MLLTRASSRHSHSFDPSLLAFFFDELDTEINRMIKKKNRVTHLMILPALFFFFLSYIASPPRRCCCSMCHNSSCPICCCSGRRPAPRFLCGRCQCTHHHQWAHLQASWRCDSPGLHIHTAASTSTSIHI